MASFYEDASLVVIPSGYKTSKIYAEKPTDGSGDLTFTRASGATRVGPNGLIEKVRENLVTYSNSFSNAAWTKVGGTTLTAGQTDYLGGTNAWKWEATGAATIQLAQNPAGSTIRTASIYAKAGNVSTISLWVGSAVDFNLSNGTVSSGTGVITSVGNGWYRCSAFGAGISHNPYFIAANSGDYVLVSFAQLETGDIATAYIPTTTAAVSVGPVSNVPRLDYLGSSCPRLLLEPQRTNSQTYSEQINNAAWGLSGVSVSANNATSPDGYTNADKIVESAANARHEFYGVSASFSGNNSVSFFAKAAGRRYICALEPTGAGGATFDLQTGTVATVTAVSASIENYGNGWYRCSVVINKTATTQMYYVLRTTSSVGIETYTGDGTSGVLFYGAQTELSASYATSYIPTLGASVTRVADIATKTGISSLIGVNQGSIYVELDANGLDVSAANYVFDLSDGANFDANRIAIYWTSANDLTVFYGYGGTYASVTYNFNFLTTKKIGVRWTSTQLQVVINGVAQTAVTYGNSSPTKINIASRFNDTELLSSNIKQCILFNTTLTTAQLQELTTL